MTLTFPIIVHDLQYGTVSSTLADIAAAEKEILARIVEAEGRREERRKLLKQVGELERAGGDDGDEFYDEQQGDEEGREYASGEEED